MSKVKQAPLLWGDNGLHYLMIGNEVDHNLSQFSNLCEETQAMLSLEECLI